MIIKASYFVGDIFIPQVGEGASSIANNNDKLKQFIDKYEAEILVKGLGRKLCKEFYDNINPSNGTVKTGADTKWNKLLNGDSYDIDGVTKFWRGLVDNVGNSSESLMAYYIYYHYVREGVTAMTTMSAKKGKSQNTTEAAATTKLTNAWRSLHTWYYGGKIHGSDFYVRRGILVSDYYGGDNTNDISLYQYMNDKKEDFPDWSFTGIGENQNEMGI